MFKEQSKQLQYHKKHIFERLSVFIEMVRKKQQQRQSWLFALHYNVLTCFGGRHKQTASGLISNHKEIYLYTGFQTDRLSHIGFHILQAQA
jgi:hypothetical protein